MRYCFMITWCAAWLDITTRREAKPTQKEDIAAAVSAVKGGKMKALTASKKFGIPYSMLSDLKKAILRRTLWL